MQKYRADESSTQADGAIVWRSRWMGGLTLAKIENCRCTSLSGEPRVTAYTLGHPDTFFSIPAACSYKGKRLKGYITSDDGVLEFRHTYY